MPNAKLTFTPRLSLDSDERVSMIVDTEIPRGDEWTKVVTDENTGKHWMAAGASCGSPACFCDAIIICEVSDEMMDEITYSA